MNTAPPFKENAGCPYGCAKLGMPSPQNVEEDLLIEENAHQIHQRLHALPEPYREVFTLRVFAELPYTQIGELFGKSENWARVTYYRAKQKIKEGL